MRKGTVQLLRGICLGVSLFCVTMAYGQFNHPGILSGQRELDFIKATVAANNGSPLIAGYQSLANDSKGVLTYTAEPYADVAVVASGSGPAEAAFRRDAHAAYIHAMKWVVTGDNAYRDKSIEIMNAWSATFQTMHCTDPSKASQTTLESSWALPIWLSAAEIIKYYNGGAAGWSSANVAAFESYVRKVLTFVNGHVEPAPNWFISQGLSLMAAGIYLNEQSTYTAGYNIITPQLDAIATTGETPELTRDFVHSQYVLIGLTQAAEVAYQQGDNSLYMRTSGASQPRLLLGAEHYTACLMGTATPNYQTDSGWARKSAPYEILFSRYSQFGLSIPNTQTYVLTQNRTETGIEDHFLGWLSATHSQLAPIQFPGRIEAENYDNGGAGISYSDNTTGNLGGAYRTDDVDIQTVTTDGMPGYALAYNATGEWLQYTVNVAVAGVYKLSARVAATASGKTFHVEVNGQNISGAIAVPVTGAYTTYQTVTVTTTALAAGQQTLRLVLDASSFNINYLDFAVAPPVGQTVTLLGSNGKYVSGENGTIAMTCTRATAGAWEKFLIVDAGNGKIGLQSMTKFASSENGATTGMNCNRTSMGGSGSWEQFDWVVNANGSVSIRGNNGKYVSSENGTKAITCTRASISAWEQFTYAITTAGRLGAEEEVAQGENFNTDVVLYPNPVEAGQANVLNIQFAEDAGDVRVNFMDINGNQFFNKEFKNVKNQIQVQLPSLSRGMYLVGVQGKHSRVQKFVVK